MEIQFVFNYNLAHSMHHRQEENAQRESTFAVNVSCV